MARCRPPVQRTLHQTGHIKYAIQGTSANLSYVSWCCLSGVRCQHFGFIFLLEATSLSFSIHFLFQVMQQYQCSFEFNDKFLQTLFENAYSSNYGKDHVDIVTNTTSHQRLSKDHLLSIQCYYWMRVVSVLCFLWNIFLCNQGTFMGDCDYDRDKHGVRKNTVSLW